MTSLLGSVQNINSEVRIILLQNKITDVAEVDITPFWVDVCFQSTNKVQI